MNFLPRVYFRDLTPLIAAIIINRMVHKGKFWEVRGWEKVKLKVYIVEGKVLSVLILC